MGGQWQSARQLVARRVSKNSRAERVKLEGRVGLGRGGEHAAKRFPTRLDVVLVLVLVLELAGDGVRPCEERSGRLMERISPSPTTIHAPSQPQPFPCCFCCWPHATPAWESSPALIPGRRRDPRPGRASARGPDSARDMHRTFSFLKADPLLDQSSMIADIRSSALGPPSLQDSVLRRSRSSKLERPSNSPPAYHAFSSTH
jgi:hypothetical protein